MPRPSRSKPRPPLSAASLEELALFYVGRYATTRARLRRYLERKIRERGWESDAPPDIAVIAEKFAERGYIDDRGFANMRAYSLVRRGYGPRRLNGRLYADGIEDEDGEEAREIARKGAWDSAEIFAKKRRIGPFAAEPLDDNARQKAFAAMMRAGHDIDLVKKFINSEPGSPPERDA
ncbi:MAG: RecX family transcriptional regulator [Sphingomonadaceae bacterium]|nr:RecX family transcriptional regulator [Sphingomonadaceae bacterium]